jgi:nucleoid-associated protein YgaU
MNKLTDKRSVAFDYTSRYSGVPYYYDTVKNRDVPGIGYQIDFNTPYVLHVVKADDTLDKLALEYYDNPSYWWAIAYFNKINDPFISLAVSYTSLKIPTISSIVFEG